jgi:nitroreductase
MELFDAMRTNPACRSFTDQPVDNALLHRILDSARFAPSGGNTQPWKVIQVQDRAKRLALQGLAGEVWSEYLAIRDAGFRPFSVADDGRTKGYPTDLPIPAGKRTDGVIGAMVDAPVLLIVAVELPKLAMMDIDLERKTFIGGGTIYPFCQNILLGARSVGLGSVLATFLARKEPETKAILNIPQRYGVAAMIAMGYPTQSITKLKRNPVETFTTIDAFDGEPFTLTEQQ